MKITFTILLLGCMCVSAAVRSQDKKISINADKMSIANLLHLIESKSPYKFTYSTDLFPAESLVNINVTETPVSAVLSAALQGTGFDYKLLENNLIAITKTNDSPAGQNYSITGLVTNETGEPLPGAAIKIKDDSHKGYVTDVNGKYSIRVGAGSVLIFSYLGFNSQEVTVLNNGVLNIRMQPSFGSLQEVVVVGYGKQAKSTLTGAVSSVSGSDLLSTPAANITQALAGRLPGLISYVAGGQPGGDSATLLIRGLSTTGDNSPLIVIDGIARSNFSNLNPLSYIDANDIESISILKDASATAIYGARAANGAILVTTKRGTEGSPTISYSGNVAVQKASFLYHPLDSYTTALFWNEAWQNEGTFAPTIGGARGFSDSALNAIKNGTDPNRYSNTNWYKAVFGDTPIQTEHNLSVSGGSSKTNYFISAGYLNQNGFYDPSGFQRYNIRSNIDGKITKNIEFSLSLSGREETTNDSYSSVTNALNVTPLQPLIYTNGTYAYNPADVGSPYAISKGLDGYKKITRDYFESSASLTYHIPHIDGLSVKGLMSFDKYFFFNKSFNKTYNAYILNDNNTFTLPPTLSGRTPSLLESYSQVQSVTDEASVNYQHSFGLNSFNGLLLYTETRNSGDNFYAQRVNFPSSILDQLDEGNVAGQTNGGAGTQNARRGFVGRLSYNYNLKYLAEFSFRDDGSDLFPPEHRYGFFPAVSAGWRLSEEDFIKNNFKFITSLKLRGSWGQAGNDRAGAFQYLNTYLFDGSSYGFGGTAGTPVATLSPGAIANPVFTWEKATTTNIGLEANLWNNLLGIEVDVFEKRTDNILVSLANSIPLLIGGKLPVENYGIVDNKGIEIQLNHQSSIGKVHYFVRPTFTFNRSRVIRYPQPANIPPGQQLQGRPVSPDALIGYIADGLYQSQAEINSGPTPPVANVKPGDIKYEDVNHDGKITSADQVIIYKGRTPGTVYGLNLGFSYNGFDVNAFLQGAGDAQTYIPGQLNGGLFQQTEIAYPLWEDHWTPANTSASFPRLTVTSQNNTLGSSFWIRNANYVRLKSAEVGYQLPVKLTSHLKLKGVRVFANGSNLFTFSHLKNIVDPEGSYSAYPLVRTFNFGLNVKI